MCDDVCGPALAPADWQKQETPHFTPFIPAKFTPGMCKMSEWIFRARPDIFLMRVRARDRWKKRTALKYKTFDYVGRPKTQLPLSFSMKSLTSVTYLSAGCRGVPRVCRRRRAARAAAVGRVLDAAGRRRCSRQSASCRLPRTRSSARPTAATAGRVHTTSGLDLHRVTARTRHYTTSLSHIS